MAGGGGLMEGAGPGLALAMLQGRAFLAVPVGMGCGIGIWFGLPFEPGGREYLWAAVAMVGLAALPLPQRWLAGRAALLGLVCILLGFLACGLRVHIVAAPILAGESYGPVKGRIVEIDRSQTGALRLTLDQVWMARRAPEETPARIRLSLHGDQRWLQPEPGAVVMATAFLSPPRGPVEPGAFDFRRMAFFEGLGAVGYTRSPVLVWQEPAPDAERVGRMRSHLSAAIRAHVPGDAGAFAAGVLTGDRSGLSPEAVAALRDSSLAHLLAISGMNMAFLVAFVFGLLRYGIALVPPLALRVNSKKAAAVVSLGVAFFYLLLSGANVATERAFIMVAVVLVAVLLDRRAITLRSVAIAATILLAWQPEALLSPGFQMSFAATVALILGFEAMSRRMEPGRLPRGGQFVASLVLASVLGGVATAPFAAAHFNRFTDYGLLANLLTGPVMGLIVMPAGAMAAVMALLGLQALPLWVMEQGCLWILAVAHRVAAMEGAVTAIPAPPGAVLPILSLALCLLVLWQGRGRWVAVAGIGVALGIWSQGARPAVLIGEGRHVGVMGPEGRALSAARGGGFLVTGWLENDGDLAGQKAAAARPGFREGAGGRVFDLGGGEVGLLVAGDAVPPGDACLRHALIVLPEAMPLVGDCLQVDDALLAGSGTLAISAGAGGLRIVAANADRRPWSPGAGPFSGGDQ